MLIFLDQNLNNYRKGLYYWDNDSSEWESFGAEWMDGYNDDNELLVFAKQAKRNGVDVVFLDNGGMGIGTDNPAESLEIKIESQNRNAIQISSSTHPNAPNIIYYTRNGTFVSQDFINDGEPIGGITANVWDGTGKSENVAIIYSAADGNHSSGNLPTRFNFSTTSSGNDAEDDNGLEMTIRATGRIGMGVDDPTAILHIKGGTASANSAPLKFNSGSLLSSVENGTIEFDGSHLYFTSSSNRKILLKGLTNTATLDFNSIASKQSGELTVSVPNTTTGSSCNCTPMGSIENGLKWSCYVSAANTVVVRLSNITAAAIDPVSKSWKVNVIE